jgi:hypothetical protein
MPNQPFGRLLALWRSLRYQANKLLPAADFTSCGFRYRNLLNEDIYRLFVNIDKKYPGLVNFAYVQRYGRTWSTNAHYLQTILNHLQGSQSFSSTSASSYSSRSLSESSSSHSKQSNSLSTLSSLSTHSTSSTSSYGAHHLSSHSSYSTQSDPNPWPN